MNIEIRQGETKDAAKIIWESAEWLIETDQLFWDLESIKEENLIKNTPKENFFVAYIDNESAAAMILDWEDPLFWPDVLPETSGFIHKLSVSRKYKAKNIPGKLLSHAEEVCLKKGIHTLRLDCGGERIKLRQYYENHGFKFLDRRIHTLPDGRFGDTAFYVKSF